MSTSIASAVPWSHRRVVSSALDALLSLQGETCQPAETKVVVHTNGAYELQAIGYPLGVTAEQLRQLRLRSAYIQAAYVDFSVQGSTGRGAVCVLVSANARRKERVDNVEDEETSGRARRRTGEKAADSAEDNEPGWLARLFGT